MTGARRKTWLQSHERSIFEGHKTQWKPVPGDQLRERTMLGQPGKTPRVGVQGQHPPSPQRVVLLSLLCLALFFCLNLPQFIFYLDNLPGLYKNCEVLVYVPLEPWTYKKFISLLFYISALGKELPGWFQPQWDADWGKRREISNMNTIPHLWWLQAVRNRRNCLSNPRIYCFLYFFPSSDHFIPCSHRWSSWAWCLPNKFPCRNNFSCRTFPAETTFPTEVQNRSRAGFMQGPQSHTNFIRKEQKLWTGEGSPGSPGSRRGFSQEQKYSYFINFILFPIFILIHQNTLSIILLLPSLTVPNGLKDPLHW